MGFFRFLSECALRACSNNIEKRPILCRNSYNDGKGFIICFILIIKVKFYSKMKWKCIFPKISPQSNPLREVITPPTKLPAGMPDRATGLAGRLCARRGRLPSKAD